MREYLAIVFVSLDYKSQSNYCQIHQYPYKYKIFIFL